MGPCSCTVTGCKNASYKLNKWKDSKCDIHSDKIKEFCGCEPPYRLYCFPAEKRYKDKRDKWISLLKKKNFDQTEWVPGKSHRVCSDHFVDRIPTEAHPNPTLKLGYPYVDENENKTPSGPPKRIVLYKLHIDKSKRSISRIIPNKTTITSKQSKQIKQTPTVSSAVNTIISKSSNISTGKWLTATDLNKSSNCLTTTSSSTSSSAGMMVPFSEHNYCMSSEKCQPCRKKDVLIDAMNHKIDKLMKENKRLKEKMKKKNALRQKRIITRIITTPTSTVTVSEPITGNVE